MFIKDSFVLLIRYSEKDLNIKNTPLRTRQCCDMFLLLFLFEYNAIKTNLEQGFNGIYLIIVIK